MSKRAWHMRTHPRAHACNTRFCPPCTYFCAQGCRLHRDSPFLCTLQGLRSGFLFLPAPGFPARVSGSLGLCVSWSLSAAPSLRLWGPVSMDPSTRDPEVSKQSLVSGESEKRAEFGKGSLGEARQRRWKGGSGRGPEPGSGRGRGSCLRTADVAAPRAADGAVKCKWSFCNGN